MVEISCLANLQKYIETCAYRLYDDIESTTQIFSRYILTDIPINVHYSHKTKDTYHDHLLTQFFLGIGHHVFQHIDRLQLNYH